MLIITFSSRTESWWPMYRAMFGNNNNISLVKNAKNCDIVIVTYWDVGFSQQFPNALVVFISGEPKPLPKGARIDIVVDCKQAKTSSHLYFPFYASSFFERTHHTPFHLIKDTSSLPTKSKFCAYMYRYDIPHRVALFDALNKYKPVDALGKSRNKNKRHTFQGNNPYDAAVSLYQPYKFVICCENHVIPGYITEKIINAMLAGAIPIYYGALDVVSHFNPHSFIRVQDFPNLTSMVAHVQKIDQDAVLYNQLRQEPWLQSNQLNAYLELEKQTYRIGEFIIQKQLSQDRHRRSDDFSKGVRPVSPLANNLRHRKSNDFSKGVRPLATNLTHQRSNAFSSSFRVHSLRFNKARSPIRRAHSLVSNRILNRSAGFASMMSKSRSPSNVLMPRLNIRRRMIRRRKNY
jgi:hypothetical protein